MDTKAKIMKEYDEKSTLYKNFAEKIRQLLEELIRNKNIPYNYISCRLKKKVSLGEKIDRKDNKYKSLEDLTDIAGVRIITFYSDDVDRVVELVEKEFQVDRKNSIDKGKSLDPDRFGYCSVHYVVGFKSNRLALSEYGPYKGLKCEIQIRTVLQHAWAEIEHDLGYKSEIAIPKDVRRNFSRLAGLLEIGDKEFLEIRNFLSTYTNEVAGKIKEKELNNREIDAIILNEFIKTDSDLIALNKAIENIAGKKIRDNLENFNCEKDIIRLQWLGIRKLGQLKKLIVSRKDFALKIAHILFSRKDDAPSNTSYIDKTIGIFYLCYAELLSKYQDYNAIKSYFDCANIQVDNDFPQYLLTIRENVQ